MTENREKPVEKDSLTNGFGARDVGLLGAAKIIAIIWAGFVPFMVPAAMIMKSEMRDINREQDMSIAANYVSKVEFLYLKEKIGELQVSIMELRKELAADDRAKR